MSELISGKEAKLAWANGEKVQIRSHHWDNFDDLTHDFKLEVFDLNEFEFSLKPRTITINGIEVPAPFEPKEFEDCYMLTDLYEHGYTMTSWKYCKQVPAWRSEEEIKQVVAALRSIFK